MQNIDKQRVYMGSGTSGRGAHRCFWEVVQQQASSGLQVRFGGFADAWW